MQTNIKVAIAQTLAVGAALALFALSPALEAQDAYKAVPGWGQQLPNGMKWGETSGMAIDAKGTILAFTRAEPPVVELNADGKVLRTWGDKIFVWPHGIRVDRDGNIWITDGQNNDEKTNGQLVYKFSPDHKLLMTIGTKGVAGDGEYTFNGPTDVAIGKNGDIFVTDGHVNARVVKYTKDGKFIKAWGRKGTGPGEFNLPHSVAIDSQGRVFVADRSNNRIQIFDQDGKFLEQWDQFGGDSSITIFPDDTLYAVDTYKFKAVFIGNAKTGVVTSKFTDLSIAEGLAVDPKTRTIYTGEVRPDKIGDMPTGSTVRKLVKQGAAGSRD
ncbi:MAG: peptidyl-alpha-hydroxyglycine alpha-amidating lyase family protein [Chitinophagaceae bacterium]